MAPRVSLLLLFRKYTSVPGPEPRSWSQRGLEPYAHTEGRRIVGEPGESSEGRRPFDRDRFCRPRLSRRWAQSLTTRGESIAGRREEVVLTFTAVPERCGRFASSLEGA